MPAYNLNPLPQPGQGIYGRVPGSVNLPQPFSDLASLYPNLTGTTGQVSSNIAAKLRGELSPETISALQDDAARFGITSGMGPGSGLGQNRLFAGLAGARGALQQQGIQDYSQVLPMLSRVGTVSPETQIDVAERNALYGAAPNPEAAQTYAQQLFDQYLAKLRGPAAGTGRYIHDPTGETYFGTADPTPG